MAIHTFEVRNLKTHWSPDGGGYQATLYIDGKRRCLVYDAGHGGCLELYGAGKTPLDAEGRASIIALLNSAAATLPPLNLGEAGTVPQDWECFVGELVDRAEITRWVRTSIVIALPGGEHMQLKPSKPHTITEFIDTPTKVARLEAKYKGTVVNGSEPVSPMRIECGS